MSTMSTARPTLTPIQHAHLVATRGHPAIASSDPEAVEKLTARIAALEEARDTMKKVNAALRLKSVIQGNRRLQELGVAETILEQARREGGFEAWRLYNLGQTIARLRKRLAEMKAEAERVPAENVEGNGYRVIENTGLGRIQIVFDEKPDTDTRALLKRNGFRWAPSQDAWQRHLNENGRYTVRRVAVVLSAP